MSIPVRRNLFIGRFSPWHSGHKFIVDKALENGESVAIAVRERPLTEGDPYSVTERIQMISDTYVEEIASGTVIVFPICDISAVSIGRLVGYDVNRYDAPEDIKGISATGIRKAMAEGDPSWKEVVPEGTVKFFENREGQVLWFTGPSGSGKTTIAQAAAKELELCGKKVKILDGDELRKGISNNLGLSPEDRTEHNRRVAHMAKAIADVGGVCIVALISPYKVNREVAEEIIGKDRFNLIHIESTKEERIERDPKGLYKKAIAGEIKNLTGYDGEYDNPNETGETHITLNTTDQTVEECVEKLMESVNL